jgi:predicted RNase H-like nuclease (RuvC/YqgF family)
MPDVKDIFSLVSILISIATAIFAWRKTASDVLETNTSTSIELMREMRLDLTTAKESLKIAEDSLEECKQSKDELSKTIKRLKECIEELQKNHGGAEC